MPSAALANGGQPPTSTMTSNKPDQDQGLKAAGALKEASVEPENLGPLGPALLIAEKKCRNLEKRKVSHQFFCQLYYFPLSNIRPWSPIFFGPNPHMVSLI